MDLERIDRQTIATRRVARIILVAVGAAGGRCTRAELSRGFSLLDMRPTVGEITDALRYLRSIERVHLTIHSYIDFGDCEVIATPDHAAPSVSELAEMLA